MMNNNRIAVGLDIGTTKIVAMVGRRNEHGKIEILGIGKSKSKGVKRGVVTHITQTINSIKEAVSKAEETSGIKITDVTVGIAGQHIRSLQHSDYITRPNFEDVIDENDIKKLVNQVHKLVMLPGEEIIHVLPQEYKVDSQETTEPIGMYGSRLEANFHVVVGQVASIKNIARCVKNAGLNLKAITLEPLASADATLSCEEKEAGVALVDIGGGTTDIAVFKNNMIRHTSVIPFGGNVITDDIKDGCSIVEKHAELLKEKFGSAWPGENKENEIISIPGITKDSEPREISMKKLSQIIHARVTEILEQSYQELRHYGCEDRKKQLIAGIVMTGGGSKLKHIRQLSGYVTGMDVRIGTSDQFISGNLVEAEKIAGPEFATVIGLVMKGLDDMEDYEEIEIEIEVENEVAEETAGSEVKKKQRKVKTEKREKSKAAGILSKWADKFIQMINESE